MRLLEVPSCNTKSSSLDRVTKNGTIVHKLVETHVHAEIFHSATVFL